VLSVMAILLGALGLQLLLYLLLDSPTAAALISGAAFGVAILMSSRQGPIGTPTEKEIHFQRARRPFFAVGGACGIAASGLAVLDGPVVLKGGLFVSMLALILAGSLAGKRVEREWSGDPGGTAT
jgi:peptidoglycan/LPS O-acetylase OafA/YrhL